MNRSTNQQLVEVRGDLRIAVTDAGSGAAVVLLHGWPVTSFHWRRTVPALLERGLRAVSIDLRGLGASAGGRTVFTKEALAEDVIAVLDRLGVVRFGVVGHDWGGTVGYLLAADHRDRVAALVVEEELIFGSAPMVEPGRSHYPRWHGPFLRQAGLAEALVPGREDAFYGTFLRQSAGPLGLEAEAERVYLDAYRSPSALTASVGYYRCEEEDGRALRARANSPLSIPVLSVGGEYGMGTAVGEDLREVARRLEHVQMPYARRASSGSSTSSG